MTNALGLGLVRQPTTVLFGPGQRRQLGRLARRMGNTVLIVTDERMASTQIFAELKADLEDQGLRVSAFTNALPELPRSNVTEVVARFSDPAPDLIVGLGGGSCMDLAKACSAVLRYGGDVRDYFGEFAVPGPTVPTIAVPTTGGTGAEVTNLAIVFDEEKQMKMAIADTHIVPNVAIIDPELTVTCPPSLTAATAADALSHLVEGYTARPKNPSADQLASEVYVGKNRITDVFCEEGLRLMNRSLARVVEAPEDLSARSDVMFAAYCAGMVINTTGTAAAHAIQSPMAAIDHTPHGFGVGALLPYVMRANQPYAREEFARMAEILGVSSKGATDDTNGMAAIERIEELLGAVGAPLELASLGVREEHFDQIAKSAVSARRLVLNNPADLTEDLVKEVLKKGVAGDRS
ncbi:iron-containing alcohol dehydrogenase [Maritimibacter sp. DP07]|uniref:Iron-containing alcohol dehydrogenase n=2 Tax=Maritimibacter harenae TaxID=2606218 RepID=A0A845M7F9_9RHOB|nr:iron-containing alcohol dehydrogenase [Maritimibacter harenae]